MILKTLCFLSHLVHWSHSLSHLVHWSLNCICFSVTNGFLEFSLKWLISRRDALDWGAAGSFELIQCYWNLKPISKLNCASTQDIFMEYWSAIENLAPWMWWILFWCISERSTPDSPQSNSYHMKINQIRETITGSVNLRQAFYQNW